MTSRCWEQKLFQSESLTKNNSELLVVVTPELVQPIAAGTQPGIPMPSEFMKDTPAKLPACQIRPDTNPLRVSRRKVPFEPSEKKPAAALVNPAASSTNSTKDFLPGGMKP